MGLAGPASAPTPVGALSPAGADGDGCPSTAWAPSPTPSTGSRRHLPLPAKTRRALGGQPELQHAVPARRRQRPARGHA
eukprot:14330093-Alexandrium_andersonii.AAC.1